MLVVDLHALQTVDVLHLVDDVARQFLDAQQAQDVLRIGRAVDDRLAPVDHLAFVHQDVLLLGHQVLVLLAVGVGDLQAHLALGLLAERHRAGDLGQHALVLRAARLEQLGHPRQTAGDVARLLAFDRDARQHFAGRQILAVAHWISEPTGKPIVTEWSVPGILTSLPAASSSLTCGRTHLGRAAALGVDHHQRRQAGDLVDLLGHRDAFLDVLELRACRRTR